MAELDLRDTLQNWVEDTFESDELFVLDIEVKGFTGSRTITIYLDGDQGVSLTECTRISRSLSSKLEEDDIVKGRFDLRVSSPGSERSLMVPRQYPKHIGRDVELEQEVGEGDGKNTKIKGKLISTDDSKIELETSDGLKTIAHDHITSARIVHPW